MIPRIGFLLLLPIVLLHAPGALALDPGKRITQYQHKAWRVQDGLLPSGPLWVSQTADGYLWVGGASMRTFRFDGVRFLPWSSPTAFSNDVRNFLPDKSGGFWIRDRRSVTHVMGNRVIAHFEFQGAHFPDLDQDMFEDVDGSLWVVMSAYEGARAPLCKVTVLGTHCFGDAEGMPLQRADSILPDGEGGFWIGTDTALVHWKADDSKVYVIAAMRSHPGRDGIVSLVSNSDGSLWLGIARSGPGLGLERFVRGEVTPFATRNFDGSKIVVRALLRNSDRDLWVGTDTNGLYRIHGGTVEHFGTAEGLSSDTISGLYEDREGTIWVTTSNGLDSFADRDVTTFSHSEGLSSDLVESVMASRDGTVWAGDTGSLDFIRDEKVFSVRSRHGLPGDHVMSLFQDRAGHVWVGVDDGLFVYENHRFRRLPEPDHRPLGTVLSIAEDVDGNIWAECGSLPPKLVRIRNFQVQEEFFNSQVPAGRALAADPNGGIWIGAMTGDLLRFRDGRVQTFQLKLKGDFPRQIEAESDGSVLLAAPSDGLIGWRRGSFQRLTMKNGLPCDGVLGFVRDDEKRWWLEAPCGYIVVADSEMQRWWARPDTTVQFRLFDTLDGARTNLVSFKSAAKSPDGRLWFATDVLQTIDPHRLFNGLPPPVNIEEMTADGKTYDVSSGISRPTRLAPLIRDLEIDYTALSLVAPEKVVFRYKLEGRDADWHDVGNRRQAFYNNLAPGNYRFRVIASNNGGVWNDQGAFLDFSIAPAYYQTSWFRLLCVTAFLGLLWGLYQLRLRQLAREFDAGLEARINERTRIARELHDSLLQSFQGLMFRLQAVRDLLPGRPSEAMEALDVALERGDKAIVEGRDTVSDLRQSVGEEKDLAAALTALGTELAAQGDNGPGPSVRVLLEGKERALDPTLRDEIYRIAREALRNAFRHAKAREIEAVITYGVSEFLLHVRDDGIGIAPGVGDRGVRVGHWGLPGMRERAKSFGGTLEVWSEDGAGTEIELIVPAVVAYSDSKTRRRFWLWRKKIEKTNGQQQS